MIDWIPLPEDADERRMFDGGTKLMQGDVRLNIANMLRLFAVAHPGGSYADQCRIMANEVAKLELPDGVAGTITLASGEVLREGEDYERAAGVAEVPRG